MALAAHRRRRANAVGSCISPGCPVLPPQPAVPPGGLPSRDATVNHANDRERAQRNTAPQNLRSGLPWTAMLAGRPGRAYRFAFALRSRCVTAGCLGSAAAGSSVRRLRSSGGAFPAGAPVTGRRLRRRRRRCKWRAGPAAVPSAARNTGAPVRSPMAKSIARAVRGASGMVTTLPPLRVIVRVRWPRSRPRCSMSAPVASETRSPRAARSAHALPEARARRLPVARRARCGRARRRETRSPPADDGRARRVSARGVPLSTAYL